LLENAAPSLQVGSCLVPRMWLAERGVHPCGDGYWNTVMESGSPARVVSTEYRAIAGGHG